MNSRYSEIAFSHSDGDSRGSKRLYFSASSAALELNPPAFSYFVLRTVEAVLLFFIPTIRRARRRPQGQRDQVGPGCRRSVARGARCLQVHSKAV